MKSRMDPAPLLAALRAITMELAWAPSTHARYKAYTRALAVIAEAEGRTKEDVELDLGIETRRYAQKAAALISQPAKRIARDIARIDNVDDTMELERRIVFRRAELGRKVKPREGGIGGGA